MDFLVQIEKRKLLAEEARKQVIAILLIIVHNPAILKCWITYFL